MATSGWRARGPSGAALQAAALALAVASAANAQQAATVGGSLLDRASRAPVEGARVSILGSSLGASTDSAGRFEVGGVPAGVRVFQVRAIGYAVSSWIVELGEGQHLRQVFELERRAILLDSITVAGGPANWRSEAGFEQRRLRGDGFFITRQQIQQRYATNIADLMRTVPSVMTTCNGRGCVVRMLRGARPCLPEYFLDGFPATFATGPSFPISQIRGVEVYRDRFEVPAEFQRPNLACGVIAIWTIEPGTPLERR